MAAFNNLDHPRDNDGGRYDKDMTVFTTPSSSIIRSADGFETSSLSPPPPPNCTRGRLYIGMSDTEQPIVQNVHGEGIDMMAMKGVVPPPPLSTMFPDELMLPMFDHEENHDRNINISSIDSTTSSMDDSSSTSSTLPPARMLQSLSLNKKRRRLSCSSARSLHGKKTGTTSLVGRPTRQRSPPSLRPLDDPLDSRFVSEAMSFGHEDRSDKDDLRNNMMDTSSSPSMMDSKEDDYDEDDEEMAIRTAVKCLNENNKIESNMANCIKASFRSRSSMVRKRFSALALSSTGTSNSKRRTSLESVFVL